ncbi:MAG TPA: glycoside hydrolase family 43 protein, partial [Pilimelia sp.]|nr:glycoside hydrolase family 43 protein [Pilimelia sp.]
QQQEEHMTRPVRLIARVRAMAAGLFAAARRGVPSALRPGRGGRLLLAGGLAMATLLACSSPAESPDRAATPSAPADSAPPPSPGPMPARYTNPLVEQRADPHIVRHTDGLYYMTATVPEYDRLVLRRAATLQGLQDAPEKVLWRKRDSGELSANIWAPEIHFIDGKWYIYFAAGQAEDRFRIRMYVLENSSPDPLLGEWVEKGRIATPWDTFALDATTFVAGGVRYLAWAQAEPGIRTNSNLYLARLANPWTIEGVPARLSVPTLDWEIRGFKVNEGAAAIQRGGKIFLTYSASATDANYCMGMLTATASSDLLDPASWTKSQQPVFASNAATGQYGPGHNSFTVAEDGRTQILVYHDRSYRDIAGDPLDDPNRRTRIQPFTWDASGSPRFGVPVADGPTPSRPGS